MPTVAELSDPYALFMRNPLRGGPDVCGVCHTFTSGYSTCYRCGRGSRFADLVVPISYSEHFSQLHTNLAAYKRAPASAAGPVQMQLAAVLWRFLAEHESCLATRTTGATRFDLVTTVPSSVVDRDRRHPLRRMVAEVVGPTRDRFERLLMRSGTAVAERAVDPLKYSPTQTLSGESVLVIDDTWTTGANAQSAAGALKTSGAGGVAVLAIGRHVNPEFQDNAARLRRLPEFSWDVCAVH